MEPLIKHISNNVALQDKILLSNDENLIESTYFLFLHYGHSLEYFLKTTVRQELNNDGIDSVFRQNRMIDRLIADFFGRFGGKFDFIVNKIRSIAVQYKAGKSEKHLKKSAILVLDYLDETLISVMSEILIDFCCDVCVCINTLGKHGMGENIVGSFIFFRILAVKIIKTISEKEQIHVMPLIKTLNKIASGETDTTAITTQTGTVLFTQPNIAKKFIVTQNQRFRALVARAMMQHREIKYMCQNKLTAIKYAQYSEIFLKALSQIRKLRSRNHIIPKLDLSQISSQYSSSSNNFDPLDLLLKDALTPRRITSIAHNFRYFLLWSHDEVIEMLSQKGGLFTDELSLEFFEYWKIDGAAFFQLDEETLKIMGMKDQQQINKIVDYVRDLKEIAITDEKDLDLQVKNWSEKDLCCWLSVKDRAHLIDIFQTYHIDGKTLLSAGLDIFKALEITMPRDICTLMQLINNSS